MKFTQLPIAGAWLIEAEPFADHRGVFRRHFCRDEFAAHGIDPNVAQGNISENPARGTLRGFHFQYPPSLESKTFSCMSGAVYDIILDLRPESPTYLKWTSVSFSAKERNGIHVPGGCANAWITLEDNTWIHYYMASKYEPHREGGIRYDDPAFGFKWPMEPIVMSDKDLSFPAFDAKTFRKGL